jgi:hypothetical protein
VNNDEKLGDVHISNVVSDKNITYEFEGARVGEPVGCIVGLI